ncbi:MAG: SDR family oxidoreductase [Rickettsia endosymbiont of Pseudomimeciton antennatum]|nr:SDR family oxidoreductase [Rickettsia endosymbiont of Pseudomimeciton antennatum]
MGRNSSNFDEIKGGGLRVLVIGANGFIGSYITAELLKDNHDVICAVRDIKATERKFPNTQIIACDFNSDTDPQKWIDKLQNIDVVINVAGVLTSTNTNKIENVHISGPKALFDACVIAKIKRVIHISALGIDDEKTTDYALTKREADNYLKTLKNIDWLILQPSLVYTSGCYGGTSLFRALSSLPYFIPLIGDGLQQFQPIHMDDLTKVILNCVKKDGITCKVLKVVGPEIVTVKDILINFRRWLGLPPASLIKIPLIFIRLGAKLGDIFAIGPLNSTSYRMLMQPNIADKEDFVNFSSITPRSFELGLATEPLTVQSLWHARLFLLKPLVKITLGLFWIVTGVISAFFAPELAIKTIAELGFSKHIAHYILYSSCFTDIILGYLLIIKHRITNICLLQILLIFAYTFFLTFIKPDLWLEPLGSLTKNIPIILLTIILLAIERDK